MKLPTNKILLLTDYKGFFGSKQITTIYRGGMDIEQIVNQFKNLGFIVEVCHFTEIDYTKIKEEKPFVIYTSAEDHNDFYKSFIEDIIYDLSEQGITVIPRYSYLKAHNNKVALELLRNRSSFSSIHTIYSMTFGCLDELKLKLKSSIINYPVVIKSFAGAMSKGVSLASNQQELIIQVKKYSCTSNFKHDIKEILRKIKYQGKYVKESFNRKKFIVQNLIPGLCNDWKVLVYGSKCYVLYRGNRENDFRASGSGKFEFRRDIPEGLLDFANDVKAYFNVPNISLDVGFDGKAFHLIEFQFLNFGTTTLEKSGFYFQNSKEGWIIVEGKSNLEEIYAESIIRFLNTTD